MTQDLPASRARDCLKIIEKDPGFGIHKNRHYATFGKILVVDRKLNNVVGPTKEYYECIRDNGRIYTENIAQQENQIRQLYTRLDELRNVNEENTIMLTRKIARLLKR